jgi:hypothetical protein
MAIRYRGTKTWTELAGVIRGGKLFVGNQSLAYALAEGMKVPRVLETFQDCPNCDPLGKDGHVRLTDGVIRRYVLGEGNADEFGMSRSPWMFTPFKSIRRQKAENVSTCLVIPGCCNGERIAAIASEAKAMGTFVIVQETGASFEEMVRLGAAKADSQYICVVDADAGVSYADVETVRYQLLDGKGGLAGTTFCSKFRPHVSGPVIAVTRRAYEQLGFFNPAMLPGELNLVEMNLRYERGKYGCKSAALTKWMSWEGRSASEWEERNIGYIEKVYGVKI